jgi:hypothetical protein
MSSDFTYRREKVGEVVGEGWRVEVHNVEVKGKRGLSYSLVRGDDTVILLLDEENHPKLLSLVKLKREDKGGNVVETEVDQTLLDFLNRKVVRSVADLVQEKDKGASGLRSLNLRTSEARDLP